MAYTRRDQKHLAIDSNVLVAYLDKEHPQHSKVGSLSSRQVALNPTVVHETYHTLVFKMKWEADNASGVLAEMLEDTNILFLNQTKETTRIGLRFAERYGLGGRDALILASFLNPSIAEFETFDEKLVQLRKVEHGRRNLTLRTIG
jgi:predicted nucleic acid-binding protein